MAGVSDLFLRWPAACGNSSECSPGGEPDIGGEGREAQQGVGFGLDRLRFSENREGSLSNLCLLNEGGIGGTPGSRMECMGVTDNLRPREAMTEFGHADEVRALEDAGQRGDWRNSEDVDKLPIDQPSDSMIKRIYAAHNAV